MSKVGTALGILDRMRRSIEGNIQHRRPLWYEVVTRFPPPVFYAVQKPKPATLSEPEVYQRFFQRYPDPKLQDALFTGKKNPRVVYLKKYVTHFEDLVAKGASKEEAFEKAIKHYEASLKFRKELDKTALQEAYHFGARLDFVPQKNQDYEKAIQRIRRNKLVEVEKRMQELEEEWEKLHGKDKQNGRN